MVSLRRACSGTQVTFDCRATDLKLFGKFASWHIGFVQCNLLFFFSTAATAACSKLRMGSQRRHKMRWLNLNKRICVVIDHWWWGRSSKREG